MTVTTQPGGGNSQRPQPSGLADVIDTILDKGLVVDAYVRVSLVGIELLTIDARVVVASVDTYLRFAEAVNRLDISQEKEGLPGLVGSMQEGGAKHKTKGAIEAAGDKLREFADVQDGDGAGVPAGKETDMTAQAEDRQAAGGRKGVYVYGILPGDIEVKPGSTGVGDPPGEIRIVRHGDLAALVSDVDLDRALGRSEDLFTHEELLDASAADVPVLPLRFGAVVSDDDAVAGELLGPHHDEFAAALRQLEGQAEFIVKGRYVEHAILREVLTEQPEAAQLSEQIRDADPDATRAERMQLGEIVTSAIDAKRKADTEALGDALSRQLTASVVRPPTHELDAVYAAFLVENGKADALRQAVDRIADEWRGRIELQLAGPLAAYDFVGGATPSADVPTVA